MKLNFRTLGDGKPLFILHGLLGSSDNWQTLAKSYADHHKVYLIDLRNHGRSPHSSEFSYELMVQDLVELVEDQELDSLDIMGHSMGGKVAMLFAVKHPGLVDKLIVADIAPVRYAPGHVTIFKALLSIDLSEVENRKEVDKQLSQHIRDFGVRQFLMKGLTRDSEIGYVWRYNVQALWNNYEEILKNPMEKGQQFNEETLFIRGGLSRYVKEPDLETIEQFFPGYELETIEGVGHWLHAEEPRLFYEATERFLLD